MGRDHNHWGFTVCLAGGGREGRHDLWSDRRVRLQGRRETGSRARPARDSSHLLGFDHEKLTYRYAGRDFRLTDVYGNVVKDILA